MRLSEAAAVTHGALHGRDAPFTGVAIDSRETRSDDLFVAIRGGRRDGHDFVGQAGARGAAGALVSSGGAGALAHIRVPDTTAALGQLGAHWRSRFDLPVVAVTGSNGKTTVSALLASIFNRAGHCLAPRASFNNQWGVPLTLLRLRPSHTHAVIEMGMNHPGEIAYLSGLARPGVALINNVAPAHLAELVDVQGVAAAKSEIFSGLAPRGCAVLNADDRFHDYWSGELQRLGVRRVVRFSVRPGAPVGDAAAEVSAARVAEGRIQLRIAGQRVVVDWPLPGAHNLANAAAAAAAAHAAGAACAHIGDGLRAFPGALPGRLFTFTGLHGATVIDDSYNANPVSLRIALDTLAGQGGVRIAVLGAMAELGRQSDHFHHRIGVHARRLNIHHLLCLGPRRDSGLSAYLRGFGGGAAGRRFDHLEGLMAHLLPLLPGGAVTVLVKGSRSTGMGRVVARLKAARDPVAEPAGGAPC